MEHSTEKPVSPPKGVPEKHVSTPPKTEVPPPEVAPPPPPQPRGTDFFVMDVALRITLFVATLVSVVVMVTSKQTELVPYPLDPSIRVPVEAKFNNSPALIYFVAAFSVVCLYSLITTLASISVILKPAQSTFFLVHFALLDVLMLGLAASATGTAGGVAYIGLRGNSHVNWAKVCPHYGKFCRHLGGSIGVSLFAAFLIVFLIMLAIRSLGSKIQLARKA